MHKHLMLFLLAEENYGVFVFLVRCRLYVLHALSSFGFILDPYLCRLMTKITMRHDKHMTINQYNPKAFHEALLMSVQPSSMRHSFALRLTDPLYVI